MRDLAVLDFARDRDAEIRVYGTLGDHQNGVFRINPTGQADGYLLCIASVDDGWEHVSASHPERIPTWDEMSYTHRLFFGDETAMQLHVPLADHINFDDRVLHLWRPVSGRIPRPPQYMV